MADTTEVGHTDSRAHVMIATVSGLLPIAVTMVGLRIYTRARLVGSIGPDDWVIVLALLSIIGIGATMIVMTRLGLGQHVDTLSPETIERYMFGFYVSILFYYVSLGLVKLALLLQYYPLVAVRSRKLILVIIAATSVWSLILFFMSVFDCRPIEGFWKLNIPSVCVPSLPMWYVNAAGNIATDVIIFALPIPVVWKLQMPRTQRLSLVGVFCLGFVTCTVSIVRIEYLRLGPDFTYHNVEPAGWSLAELTLATSCACLPTLRPLLFGVVGQKLIRNRFTSGKQASQGRSVPLGSAVSGAGSTKRTLVTASDGDLECKSRSLDEEGCVGCEDAGEAPAQVFRNVM